MPLFAVFQPKLELELLATVILSYGRLSLLDFEEKYFDSHFFISLSMVFLF